MRAVYRLLGLVRRYGAGPVEAACSRALDLDVVSVTKIASMLQRATEDTLPLLPTGTTSGGRFARTPAEFTTRPASPGTTPTAAITGTTPASGGASSAGGPATLTLLRGGQPVAVFHATDLTEEEA